MKIEFRPKTNNKGNILQGAKALGVGRATLYRYLVKYKVQRKYQLMNNKARRERYRSEFKDKTNRVAEPYRLLELAREREKGK